MPTDHTEPVDRLPDLAVLVGEWQQRAGDDPTPARVVFEWALDGQYLVERSTGPQPEFPDSMSIIGGGAEPGTYTQHYFDSRGVVRVYRMTLRDGVWILSRTEPDFTPLDFAQRFIGTFSADGDTIDGRWETSHDGGTTWELDFTLAFTRAG